MSNHEKEATGTRSNVPLYSILVLGVLALGILARAYDLGGMSVFEGEAWVAVKLTQNPLNKVLFDADSIHYTYPPFFGVAVHLIASVLGPGEASLRLLPCLAGIGSLIAFYFLALRMAGRWGALVALPFLAFSFWCIFFSKVLKQYPLDQLLAILCVLLGERIVHRSGRLDLLLLLMLCSVGLWFSQTLVFVIPGVLLVLFVHSVRKKSKTDVAAVLGIGGCSLASFGAMYFLIIRHQMGDFIMQYWEDKGFFIDTSSAAGLAQWTLKQSMGIFEYFFNPPFSGINAQWIALALCLIGAAAWIKTGRRYLAYILIPFALVYLANLLGKYVYGGERILLFAFPFVLLLLGKGTMVLLSQVKEQWRVIAGGAFSVLIVFWSYPGVNATLIHPVRVEESRPVIRAMEAGLEAGDRVYVNNAAQYIFRYYYSGQMERVYIGKKCREEPDVYLADVDQFVDKGGRLWLFLTHYRMAGYNEYSMIREHLSKSCRLLDEIEDIEAGAMLVYCAGRKDESAQGSAEAAEEQE